MSKEALPSLLHLPDPEWTENAGKTRCMGFAYNGPRICSSGTPTLCGIVEGGGTRHEFKRMGLDCMSQPSTWLYGRTNTNTITIALRVHPCQDVCLALTDEECADLISNLKRSQKWSIQLKKRG